MLVSFSYYLLYIILLSNYFSHMFTLCAGNTISIFRCKCVFLQHIVYLMSRSIKTRNHLFFSCTYPEEIWKLLVTICSNQLTLLIRTISLSWSLTMRMDKTRLYLLRCDLFSGEREMDTASVH